MRTVKYVDRAFLAIIMTVFGPTVAGSSGTIPGALIGITPPLLAMATIIFRTF